MIDGAVDFHAYLREEGIPYVFCSNTGAARAQHRAVRLADGGAAERRLLELAPTPGPGGHTRRSRSRP